MLFKTTIQKLNTRSHGMVLWLGQKFNAPSDHKTKVLSEHPISLSDGVLNNLRAMHKRYGDGNNLLLKQEVDGFLGSWVDKALVSLSKGRREIDCTLCDDFTYGPKDALLEAVKERYPDLYGGEAVNLPPEDILHRNDLGGKGKKFILAENEPDLVGYHNQSIYNLALVNNDYVDPINYTKDAVVFYDLEVFPNLFSISGMYAGTPFCYYICSSQLSDGSPMVVNQIRDWVEFMDDRNKTWTGFNNAEYDDILQTLLIHAYKEKYQYCSQQELLEETKPLLDNFYELSQSVVQSHTYQELKSRIPPKLFKVVTQAKYRPVQPRIDLYRMRPSGGTSFAFSLKHAAVRMGWKRIQDLPYRFDTILTYSQVQEVLDYNANDWQVTEQLYDLKLPEIQLRNELGRAFRVGNVLMDATESVMANHLLEKMYGDATGINIKTIKDLRTHYSEIPLESLFNKVISFNTKPFTTFYEYLKKVVLIDENAIYGDIVETNHKGVEVKIQTRKSFAFRARHHVKIDEHGITKKNFTGAKNESYNISVIDGCKVQYDIGVGGIHSVDKPAHIKSTPDEWLIDADVTSFYPYIIIIENLVPGHLNDQFPIVVALLKDSRVEMKGRMKYLKKKLVKGGASLSQEEIDRLTTEKNLCNVKQMGQKIVINAISGKFKFDGYWLYDPKCSVKMTLSGQLYLLMLIEKFNLQDGVRIISANTDGVTCAVKKEYIAEYLKICALWTKKTGFLLEFATYGQIVRRDINNYLTRSAPGVSVNFEGKQILVSDTTAEGGFKGNFDSSEATYDKIDTWFNTGDYNLPILEPTTGIPKLKGWFEMDNYKKHLFDDAESEDNTLVPIHKKGKETIVTIAVAKYYLFGTPVTETIQECDDILLFCSAPKVDGRFKVFYNNGTEDILLQKTNRVYKSTKGVMLQKREYSIFGPVYYHKYKVNGKIKKDRYDKLDSVPSNLKSVVTFNDLTIIKDKVAILNDLPSDYLDKDMFSWNIDYKWYVAEAMEMIELIEPTFTQAELF